MIDELTNYLQRQADRVRVNDTLAEIESEVTLVRTGRPNRRPQWLSPALVGAVAVVVIALIGIAESRRHSSAPAGSAVGRRAGAVSPTGAVDATAPITTVAPAQAPLPAGATLQGFTPLCTTTDGIEFDCTVEGYRHAGGYDDHGIDHTGEVQAVITAGSIVNGGCRSTSADGSTWHCALGRRAVDLEMIGASYLGQSEAPGYAAG